MNYKYVDEKDAEYEEEFTKKHRKISHGNVAKGIKLHNEILRQIKILTKQSTKLSNDIRENKCGHEELVMKVTTASMTSYHDRPGNWRSLRGHCECCGKDIYDEVMVDDEYLKVWNSDVY